MQLHEIAAACLVVIIFRRQFRRLKSGSARNPTVAPDNLHFLFAAFPAVLLIKTPNIEAKCVIAFGFTLAVVQLGLLFATMIRRE